MAEVKPIILTPEGNLREYNVATDTLPGVPGGLIDHINDTGIHSRLYIQRTEPVNWAVGDIWICGD